MNPRRTRNKRTRRRRGGTNQSKLHKMRNPSYHSKPATTVQSIIPEQTPVQSFHPEQTPVQNSNNKTVNKNNFNVPVGKTRFKRFLNYSGKLKKRLHNSMKSMYSRIPNLKSIFKNFGLNKTNQQTVIEAVSEAVSEAESKSNYTNISLDENSVKSVSHDITDFNKEITKNQQLISDLVNAFNKFALEDSISRLKLYNETKDNESVTHTTNMNLNNTTRNLAERSGRLLESAAKGTNDRELKAVIKEDYIQPLAEHLNELMTISRQSSHLNFGIQNNVERYKISIELLEKAKIKYAKCKEAYLKIVQKQDKLYNSWISWRKSLVRGATSTGKTALIGTGVILLGTGYFTFYVVLIAGQMAIVLFLLSVGPYGWYALFTTMKIAYYS